MVKKYFLFLILSLFIFSCSESGTPADTTGDGQDTVDVDHAEGINQIKHVIVIVMENRSFDNLWGQFPGADGLSDAPDSTVIQVDKNGQPYKTLPPITRSSAFPTNLPNYYFNIDKYLSSRQATPNPIHRFYRQKMQIDGGRMDKFAAYNPTGGMAMGYYKTKNLPLYGLAKKYTLCDHFFQSFYGGTLNNHLFLITAAPIKWSDAPSSIRAELDDSGNLVKGGKVSPDGYLINNIRPQIPLFSGNAIKLPLQTMDNIGDRLSKNDISWAWYGGGWNEFTKGDVSHSFIPVTAPFLYFKNYAPGTEGRKRHLKDETDFIQAAKEGTLPSVSFVKPRKGFDQHPGSGSVIKGGYHAYALVQAVKNGPDWDSSVVIITYDENGGFWDHVAPPEIDEFGPGNRIPAIIISPFAKKGYVDHTQYQTVSVTAFIEKRWDLKPLADRDKNANPLQNAFDFSNKGS
jgi:phospholipase C